jgi:glucoamylase
MCKFRRKDYRALHGFLPYTGITGGNGDSIRAVRVARLIALCAVVVAVGVVLLSGGKDDGPQTPAALPGLPLPFLGTAVAGDGGLTAAVDAYGDVVDLRPGPAGRALIDNPSDRQAAETVPEDTGIVPRVQIGGEDGGDAMAMWEADRVTQRYLAGTNVVRTVAWFNAAQVVMTVAAGDDELALTMRASGGGRNSAAVVPSIGVHVQGGVRCARQRRAALLDLICRLGRGVPPVSGSATGDGGGSASAVIRGAVADGREWLSRSGALGAGAPRWARSMYKRSLLTVHALTSAKTGAVAAGARDGWAYVWPRDAATAALALAASGHRGEARDVVRFLINLDLPTAARFDEAGAPVPGRAAQGDALGWVDAAARAAGIPEAHEPFPWRDRADYQESSPGTYLGNALAAAAAQSVDGPKTTDIEDFSAHQHRVLREFGTDRGLVRVAGEPGSGLDSAAGWAVRPFELTALYPATERTLLHLVEAGTPYGITPGEGWQGGEDPWTAPTAWSAWSLAALSTSAPRTGVLQTSTREADGRGPRTNLPVREGGVPSRRSHQSRSRSSQSRQAALTLLRDLRRAATPAGNLPERVGAHTGIPTSTTPLLWSSALAVLALRELWP